MATFASLPPELVELVLDDVSRAATSGGRQSPLWSATLVCKAWHQIAQPMLCLYDTPNPPALPFRLTTLILHANVRFSRFSPPRRFFDDIFTSSSTSLRIPELRNSRDNYAGYFGSISPSFHLVAANLTHLFLPLYEPKLHPLIALCNSLTSLAIPLISEDLEESLLGILGHLPAHPTLTDLAVYMFLEPRIGNLPISAQEYHDHLLSAIQLPTLANLVHLSLTHSRIVQLVAWQDEAYRARIARLGLSHVADEDAHSMKSLAGGAALSAVALILRLGQPEADTVDSIITQYSRFVESIDIRSTHSSGAEYFSTKRPLPLLHSLAMPGSLVHEMFTSSTRHFPALGSPESITELEINDIMIAKPLSNLIGLCPNLRKLALDGTLLVLEQELLATALQGLVELEELTLNFPAGAARHHVPTVWSSAPWKSKVTHLTLRVPRVEQADWSLIQTFTTSLTHLSLSLKGLAIGPKAPFISNTSFPNLKHLSLIGVNDNASDDDFRTILDLFSTSPISHLTYTCENQSNFLSDDSTFLPHLSTFFPSLTRLSVGRLGAESLTGPETNHLVAFCKERGIDCSGSSVFDPFVRTSDIVIPSGEPENWGCTAEEASALQKSVVEKLKESLRFGLEQLEKLGIEDDLPTTRRMLDVLRPLESERRAWLD
ncbi:hypothetical protein RQP46_008059 [Phenoliferia psychrophenolica]